MAYTAVNSLIQTLELFRTTYPALIRHQMVDSLLSTAQYFQKVLENTSHHKNEFEKIKDFEEEITAAVQQAEDLLELNVVQVMRERYNNQQGEKNNGSKWRIQDESGVLLRDMPQVIDKIDAVRKDLAQVMENIDTGTAEDHFIRIEDSPSPMRASISLLQDITVGLDDALMKITDRLLGSASEREVIPILGMGGCGKTTLAKKAQDDPSIMSRFDIQAWVTISQEYQLKQVLLSLVRSVAGNKFQDMSEDQLMEKAYRALKGRKYLIVIDDVWSTDIWDVMTRTLPNDKNGSRIILTTRLRIVAEYVNCHIPIHEMMPLSLDESWKLLSAALFRAEHDCPLEMQEIGKKIVGKCQGLPLVILVIAGHLSKLPRTKESWETVARNVSKVVTSYPNECLAVLAMSYYHMPIHLKPCFLHLGTFPEDHEIDAWRLVRLWVAEGFLKTNKLKSLEEVAEDCLEDLASRNLITVKRRKLNGHIKSCGMHDLLRDLSITEAQKESFLNVMRINRAPTFLAKSCKIPRFSLHAHFSLEKLSDFSQDVRSLHIFKQPLGLGSTGKTVDFKALRVLVSLNRLSFKYRLRVTLDSAILRYLEVRRGSNLTEAFEHLYNLQTFIFRHEKLQHDDVLTIPDCIWNMKQLRYIHIQHCLYLPNHQDCSSNNNSDLGLQHLQELSRLGFTSCTKEVLSCLPNLKKLRITKIPKDTKGLNGTSWSLLNLVFLNKLDSLYLSFSYERWKSLSPLVDNSWSFPLSLKRLTISNGLLSCEAMTIIAKLPNLEVLKLRQVTFRGLVWKLNDEDQFKQLKFLLVVDNTEIKQWEASSVNFPNLRRLVFHQIRKLKQIPQAFVEICTLESIELYMCNNPDLENSATDIQEEVASIAGYDCLQVGIYDDYDAYKRRV